MFDLLKLDEHFHDVNPFTPNSFSFDTVGIIVSMAILFSAKLSSNMKSAYLMFIAYRSLKNKSCVMLIPPILEIITSLVIICAGASTFFSITRFSDLLEGWVYSFLIQEVAGLMLKFSYFIDGDAKH